MPRKSEDKMKQQGRKNAPVIEIKAPEEMPLLPLLIEAFPERSRTTVKSYLTNKQVMVNGHPVTKHDMVVKPKDKIVLNFGWVKKKPSLNGVKILFEDRDIVVIEKEPGLLSIATDKEKRKTAYSIISEYVKSQNSKNRIFVVHRLDRETSGVMLFAKSEEVQERLQRSWADTVEVRKYVAMVEGKLEKEEDTIVSWLKEGKTFVVHACSFDNGGQKAITHYKVLHSSYRYSTLELTLETGRKNQIRVQLQSIGHPVVGDKKYGAKGNPLKRLALHAYCIEFVHPMTGEKMSFSTPFPKGFFK